MLSGRAISGLLGQCSFCLCTRDQEKRGFLGFVWGGFCCRYLASMGPVLFLLQSPF